MDPVVAAATVAAVGGLATAVVARRSTQKIDGVKVQLDAWPQLYRTVVAELQREQDARRHDVADERAIAEAFAQKADRLERERDGALEALRRCREHLTRDEHGGRHWTE